MRKKDEEVICKIVDKIIDSKILITGKGYFFIEYTEGNRDSIYDINIKNLFSEDSKIGSICISFCISHRHFQDEKRFKHYSIAVRDKVTYKTLFAYTDIMYPNDESELSPSLVRFYKYFNENKYIILQNDKEYGKTHNLTDKDFL